LGLGTARIREIGSIPFNSRLTPRKASLEESLPGRLGLGIRVQSQV